MGQTPSTQARRDNASTRTLHSSSMTSRPLSFFRRISRRLQTHPNRRFGRQRMPTTNNPPTLANTSTSIAPLTTSSVQRATVAATQAAAAATSPIPPLPFLHIDPHPSNSSAASTTSAMSNSSEISQIISDILSSSVLQSQGEGTTNDNTPFLRYIQVPIRYQAMERPSESGQSQTVLPIFIVGYHPSAVDSPPTRSYRRPHSAISTSSSLATLQSMPLSIHSNRTTATNPQHQQRETLPSSASSTRSTTSSITSGHWVIYLMGNNTNLHPALTRLSDNPTYEDLLWLSNLIGPARPVTTTQQVIDATLSTNTWSDESTKPAMLPDTQRCLVCLDDFIPKQSVRVLKCRHVFHVECVDRWLVEAHNSCPICRSVPCS